MSTFTEPRVFPDSSKAWRYLKKKTAAAKVQARREKFANDIQLIRSRKMNGTIIPVSASQQEWYFSKLESNGIWEQVFMNVTNVSDLTSSYFANELFRDHVEKKRILMLLPQVLGILRDHNYLLVKRSFTRKNILNLRHVSKAWNNATLAQFLTPLEFSELDWHLRTNTLTNQMTIVNPFCARFENIKHVEMATKVLQTSQSCPTLLKVVDIRLDLDYLFEAEKDSFISKLGELLQVHGEHVWSLHLRCPFDYKFLWDLVSRTPNLKELFWQCWESRNPFPSEDDQRMMLTQFPFPTIPTLARLTLFSIPRCKILTAEILRRNPDIKTLSIQKGTPALLWELAPVLENLPLECLDFGHSDAFMNLEDIRPLGQMRWPLQILSWYWASGRGYLREVPASEFFRILNQFNDTLEVINVGTMILRDDVRKVVVHFPNLKNIDKVVVGV